MVLSKRSLRSKMNVVCVFFYIPANFVRF